MKEHRSLSGSLIGCLLGFAFISISSAAQTTAAWTWMGGSNLVDQPGVYGVLGTPNSANFPQGRYNSVSWTDSAGNLWLFGGRGYDAAVNDTGVTLNDFWRYDPSDKEWTWVGGSSILPRGANGWPGVYGTLGTPDAINIPGSRENASTWTDSSGNLWLFGGGGLDINGDQTSLNDLCEFNPATSQWI